MSSSTLKLIALILMIIDHAVSCFRIGSKVLIISNLTLYTAIRYITRMSFPIFAYGIVEGFRKTHNRRKYGLRLFLFALISEIPWSLEHTGNLFCGSLNVMFTLFLGYLGLCVIEKLRTDNTSIKYVIYLIILFTLAYFGRMDYGVRGFGTIILMYLLNAGLSKNIAEETITAIACSVSLNNAIYVLPAFILIHFYNGESGWMKGKLRYIFYLVYPLQFLVLWYLKYIVLV